jgi:hypothetical protein
VNRARLSGVQLIFRFSRLVNSRWVSALVVTVRLCCSLGRPPREPGVPLFLTVSPTISLLGGGDLFVDLLSYGFDGGVAGDIVETLAGGQGADLRRVEVLGGPPLKGEG